MSDKLRRKTSELNELVLAMVKSAGAGKPILGADIVARLAKVSNPINRSQVYQVLQRLVAGKQLQVSGARGQQTYIVRAAVAGAERVKKAAKKAAKKAKARRKKAASESDDIKLEGNGAELVRVMGEIARAENALGSLRGRRDELVRLIDADAK